MGVVVRGPKGVCVEGIPLFQRSAYLVPLELLSIELLMPLTWLPHVKLLAYTRLVGEVE